MCHCGRKTACAGEQVYAVAGQLACLVVCVAARGFSFRASLCCVWGCFLRLEVPGNMSPSAMLALVWERGLLCVSFGFSMPCNAHNMYTCCCNQMALQVEAACLCMHSRGVTEPLGAFSSIREAWHCCSSSCACVGMLCFSPSMSLKYLCSKQVNFHMYAAVTLLGVVLLMVWAKRLSAQLPALPQQKGACIVQTADVTL